MYFLSRALVLSSQNICNYHKLEAPGTGTGDMVQVSLKAVVPEGSIEADP